MKTKLELLGRTLLIFCTTILIGTFFSAIYMVTIAFQNSATFIEYFVFGSLITTVYSIPSLFILFFGFYLIYKKCKNNRQKWQYTTLMWLINCYGPAILFISSLASNVPDDLLLIIASIPYVFTSFISIFSFTYYFDKRKPPLFEEVDIIQNDDILDAPF